MLKRLFIFIFLLPLGLYAQSSEQKMRENLEQIIATPGVRNYTDTACLNSVADFIANEFSKVTLDVTRQVYQADGRKYQNVIARIGDTTMPTIVIGAHYDVHGVQDGADDNGSGVVGLIDLIHKMKDYTGLFCLEFVAYTLEEPPYFGTNSMGSYVHANSLMQANRVVYGMISLEMIGYYSDEEGSQTYPIKLLKWFYGSKGNYILVTKQMFNGSFTRRVARNMVRNDHMKTKKLGAPKMITGIDFSDHRNYWKFGIDAFMLTDTSFYRNANYHHDTDKIYTLDFSRMAKVIDELTKALSEL